MTRDNKESLKLPYSTRTLWGQKILTFLLFLLGSILIGEALGMKDLNIRRYFLIPGMTILGYGVISLVIAVGCDFYNLGYKCGHWKGEWDERWASH